MRHTHTGYSLIELMVAMMLGLFILAGMLQVNLSSKKTYQISSYLASLQDDLKNASAIVSKSIRKAGYRSSPWRDPKDTFLADATFTTIGQVVTGSDGVSSIMPDSFTIRYQGSGDGLGMPDGIVSDCIGDAVDADDVAVITFDVNLNKLRCTTSNETRGTTVTEDFVDNIDNMQILYGVDTDGSHYANHYVNAASVTAWDQVASIRIALLLKTSYEIYNFTDNKVITLNDVTLSKSNDRFMRMQFVSTISLRNMTP